MPSPRITSRTEIRLRSPGVTNATPRTEAIRVQSPRVVTREPVGVPVVASVPVIIPPSPLVASRSSTPLVVSRQPTFTPPYVQRAGIAVERRPSFEAVQVRVHGAMDPVRAALWSRHRERLASINSATKIRAETDSRAAQKIGTLERRVKELEAREAMLDESVRVLSADNESLRRQLNDLRDTAKRTDGAPGGHTPRTEYYQLDETVTTSAGSKPPTSSNAVSTDNVPATPEQRVPGDARTAQPNWVMRLFNKSGGSQRSVPSAGASPAPSQAGLSRNSSRGTPRQLSHASPTPVSTPREWSSRGGPMGAYR